jgi:acetyltransferase
MCHLGLKSIFSPSSIAVIGASNQLQSVGGSIFANLKSGGFDGALYAVNKKPGPVQGNETFPTLTSLPCVPELVVICTPAPTVPALVRECGQLGVLGVIVISAGFREAGPAGQKLEAELVAAASEFPELQFIGPNCLGVLRPSRRLNASFSPVMPRPGRLTFLSQSGALCTAILDWSVGQDFGFATCVSVGNMANVGMGDLIDYFAEDDETDAVLLYLEGIDDPQHLLEAARQCSRRKPILAYKAGRSSESSAAASSHTGAMATSDAVCDAMFRQAGIVRVNTIQDLFDSGKLLVGCKPLRGDRLAIVTNAGGPGVIATDAWMKAGGHLAKLSLDTLVALDRALPSCWSHGNPIDVLGDAGVDRFQVAIERVIDDLSVDALLVIVTPQLMTEPEKIAQAIVAASRQTDKPIVVSMMGGPAVDPGRKVLREAGISTYDFPEEATEALSHLISTSRKQLRSLSDAPALDLNGPRVDFSLVPNRQQKWHRALGLKQGLLDEKKSKDLLSDFGIPVVKTCVATSPAEAESLAEQMGYPVALKIVSPDISHKTDVGGVVLNVTSWDGVRNGYSDIMEAAAFHSPNARLEGIAVEPMVVASQGVELLLGMRRDPQFGLVLLVGAGGVTAELQNDTALEIAPFNEETVDRMLRSLRLFPLLEGYRGRPGVDLVKLRQVIVRFARLAEELPELVTAEINPLLVTADGATALDARVIVDSRTVLQGIAACGDKCRKCADCANRSATKPN